MPSPILLWLTDINHRGPLSHQALQNVGIDLADLRARRRRSLKEIRAMQKRHVVAP